MSYIEIKHTAIERIDLLPCVECGSSDVEIDDCGYSSFNVSWGKCKSCGVKITFDGEITKREVAEEWNRCNDVDILIDKYQKQITELQEKINKLK